MQTEKMISVFKKITWRKSWEGIHPVNRIEALFMGCTWPDRPECIYKNMLVIGSGDRLTFYHDEKDIPKIKEFGSKLLEDREVVRKYLKEWKTALERFVSFCSKFDREKLSKLSNRDVFEVYQSYIKGFAELYSYYQLPREEFMTAMEDRLKNVLKENALEVHESFSVLSAPVELNSLDQCNLDVLAAALRISEKYGELKKDSVSKLAESDNEVRDLLDGLVSRYEWVPTQETAPWTEEYFAEKICKELFSRSQEQLKKNLQSIKEKGKRNSEEKALFISKNGLSQDIGEVAGFISRLMRCRLEVKLGWTKAAFMARPLVEEASKRLGLQDNEIGYFTMAEFEGGLRERQTREKIVNRKKRFVMLGNGVETCVVDGKDAESVIKGLNFVGESKNASVITGNTANSGFAKGAVRIISPGTNQEEAMKKFKEGEILVTTMTRPHLVPIMSKAKAIVTDEGGITCHAAIIAREFGKPCVMSTRIATKILKTGDIVEVDADNGVVKILSKHD